MADGHRRYPVDLVVMHHSVGSEFVNASDLTVQDWFDVVGKGRGYKNVAHSKHRHPRRNKETFSQAHYGLHKYTLNRNKYGWRLTLLMKDVFNNVAWHAGNWDINQRSLGIETCGNYVGKRLPDKALMLVADTFRAHDKSIGGILDIKYHRYYSATACPGLIASQVNTIIDMINNPAKWNAKLWPKPKPPAPKPKPETIFDKVVSDPKVVTLYFNTPLVKLPTKERIKVLPKGTKVEVAGTYGAYYISKWAYANKQNNFFEQKFTIAPPAPEPPPPEPTTSTSTTSSTSSSSTSSSSTTTLVPKIPVKGVNYLEAIKTFLGEILSRFTSRKFLLSIATIFGIGQVELGGDVGEGAIGALQIIVAITYVIVEGYIDAQRAKNP